MRTLSMVLSPALRFLFQGKRVMCEYFIPFSHKKMSYMNFVAICVGSKESLDDKGSGIIPGFKF